MKTAIIALDVAVLLFVFVALAALALVL